MKQSIQLVNAPRKRPFERNQCLWYSRSVFPDQNGQFRLYLGDDHTELRCCYLKYHKNKKGEWIRDNGKVRASRLYCSYDGRFFHLHPDGTLTQVQMSLAPKHRGKWKSSNGIYGSKYPMIRNFDGRACHLLMCEAWHGPRPGRKLGKGKYEYECDHKDGNKMNWRADNLQWVHRSVNRKRSYILRERRRIAIKENKPQLLPENMKPAELIALFAMYKLDDPHELSDREISRHRES